MNNKKIHPIKKKKSLKALNLCNELIFTLLSLFIYFFFVFKLIAFGSTTIVSEPLYTL